MLFKTGKDFIDSIQSALNHLKTIGSCFYTDSSDRIHAAGLVCGANGDIQHSADHQCHLAPTAQRLGSAVNRIRAQKRAWRGIEP